MREEHKLSEKLSLILHLNVPTERAIIYPITLIRFKVLGNSLLSRSENFPALIVHWQSIGFTLRAHIITYTMTLIDI